MSNSPEDKSGSEAEVASYLGHYAEFNRMMREGRSLSGRERNCCFLNVNGDRFADISDVANLSFPDDARGVAVVDWDYDGDLDVWLLNRTSPRIRFMRNDVETDHDFVAFRLRGKDCHRDAIGARVEVHLAGSDTPALCKTLAAGNGFATQSSKWIHFGLGNDAKIDKIVVRWPDGTRQEFAGVAPNRFYVLAERADQPQVFTPPIDAQRLEPAGPPATPDNDREPSTRIGLVGHTPLPHLEYKTWDNQRQTLAFPRSGPLLINIWASWCAPCLKELNEFTERADELEALGLDVLALTMDGLQNVESEELAESRRLINRIDFPFESGFVTVDLYQKLRLFQLEFVEPTIVAGLPASFLVTFDGNVVAIYKGPVDVDRLISDVNRLGSARSAYPNLAIEFPGRTYADPKPLEQLIRMAAMYATQNYPRDALQFAEQALQLDPNSELAVNNSLLALSTIEQSEQEAVRWQTKLDAIPKDANAHLKLGAVRHQQGDIKQALMHFSKAVEHDPELVDAHLQSGLLLAREGELKDAESHLMQVLELDPNNHAARNGLQTIKLARTRQLGPDRSP